MDDEKQPEPQDKPRPFQITLAGAMTLLVAGATGVLVLVSGSAGPTMGARASTRLQWELRQAEIDKVLRKAEAEGKLPAGEAQE